MDLGRLRLIVDALIEEEGDALAVFYITAKDVQETLQYLRVWKDRERSQPRSKTCWKNCRRTPVILG